MCFVDDDECDWFVGEETRDIVGVLDERCQCVECQCVLHRCSAIRIHQIEDESLRDFDDDCNPLPLREWTGHVCGACDLTRFRIHLHELEEGCPEYESWCPYGDLRQYCLEADFDVSSAEDGEAWVRFKLEKRDE